MINKPERRIIIIYPCLNGDKISYVGTKNYDGSYSDKQYFLVSGPSATKISTFEAQNIMAEEGFFEVMPGDCPATASGVVYTKDDPLVQTGF